jgi:hypothetical protein
MIAKTMKKITAYSPLSLYHTLLFITLLLTACGKKEEHKAEPLKDDSITKTHTNEDSLHKSDIKNSIYFDQLATGKKRL